MHLSKYFPEMAFSWTINHQEKSMIDFGYILGLVMNSRSREGLGKEFKTETMNLFLRKHAGEFEVFFKNLPLH